MNFSAEESENPYASDPDPIESDELLSQLNGGLDENTALEVGQNLQVHQVNGWWAGQILALRADGTVKIHYVGWESSWDEWVGRDRLRLASPGPRAIVLTLENGLEMRGLLRGQTRDFLILERESRRIFVAKTKILFFAVE